MKKLGTPKNRFDASYYKKPEVHDWFTCCNKKYIKYFNLSPYYPELNATEQIWWHTGKQAMHDRYFDREKELCQALLMTFDAIKNSTDSIKVYKALLFTILLFI